MNGRGIPITGANPIVIPIFIAKCINRIDATPYPYILQNDDLCLSARLIILISSSINNVIKIETPKNPHSSPMVQKMKSVLCSGTKSNLV